MEYILVTDLANATNGQVSMLVPSSWINVTVYITDTRGLCTQQAAWTTMSSLIRRSHPASAAPNPGKIKESDIAFWSDTVNLHQMMITAPVLRRPPPNQHHSRSLIYVGRELLPSLSSPSSANKSIRRRCYSSACRPLSVSRTGLVSVEPHRYSNPVHFFNGERVGGLWQCI